MASMTLKNVPDELYLQLKESADLHRRSLNSEAIVCLQRALQSERLDPKTLLARARVLRSQTPNLFVTDEEIQKAKEAGRP